MLYDSDVIVNTNLRIKTVKIEIKSVVWDGTHPLVVGITAFLTRILSRFIGCEYHQTYMSANITHIRNIKALLSSAPKPLHCSTTYLYMCE
jgi:hypothetical protein